MVEIIQRSLVNDFFRKFLRVLIVAGVLALAMLVARTTPGTEMLLMVTALPVLLGLFLLLIQWPPLGFMMLIGLAVVVNFDMEPIGVVAMFTILMVGLWLTDMIIVKKEIKIVTSPGITPLLVFSAVVLLSFLIGQLPWFSVAQVDLFAQMAGIAIFLLSFAMFILAAQQIKELKWLKWMVYLFLLSGAPAVIIGMQFIPGYRTLNQFLYHSRTTGGSLFWLWLVTFSISMALFNRNLPRKWRLMLVILTAGALYLALGRNRSWTSGWAPIFVSTFILIWVSRPRWALPLTMIGGGTFIVFFQLIYETVMVGDNAYSAETRLAAWQVLWEIIKVNPVLGLGPGNYYNYTTLFSILGWYVEFNSHNNYVDILAQTGFLGLVCFIWFVIVVGRLGYRLRNRVPEGGFAQAYTYACLAGLVGSVFAGLLGDWVLPFVYNVGIFGLRSSFTFWVFLGGLIALDQMVKNGEPLD